MTIVPNIQTRQLSTRQILKSIIILGVPLIIGELGSITQQFADTMMVGNHSTDELAASGMVNNIFLFVIFFTLGMSYAVTPIVGSAFGKNDSSSIIRSMREGLILNLVIGLVCAGMLLLLLYNIEILGQPQHLLKYAKPYFLILIASVPFMTSFFALKQYMDGLGKTGISMWIMLAANLQNILLNWILIFGKFGFPEMGLLGAGISTFISRFLQFAALLLIIWLSPAQKKLRAEASAQEMKPTVSGIRHQFLLGLPISIQLSLEISIFGVCAIFMGWIGANELAAHQVMYTISTLCFQVLYGIGAAGCILISQCRGAGNTLSMLKISRVAFSFGLIVVGGIILLLYIFFDPLSSFFTTSSEVKIVMKAILPWFILYQIGDCMQITYGNALRGIEATKPLMIIAFVAYVLISIPLSYYLGDISRLGVHGVWIGIPFGLTTAGLLFRWRYRKHCKKLENE